MPPIKNGGLGRPNPPRLLRRRRLVVDALDDAVGLLLKDFERALADYDTRDRIATLADELVSHRAEPRKTVHAAL